MRTLKEEMKEKKKKAQGREKGLDFVREVRTILKGMGKMVEGPKYKIMWVKDKRTQETKPIQIHEDFFNVWDLISWDKENGYVFYQVTTLAHWTDRKKLIEAAGLRGDIWGRDLIGGKVAYKRFFVGDGEAKEGEEVFYLKDFQPSQKDKTREMMDRF